MKSVLERPKYLTLISSSSIATFIIPITDKSEKMIKTIETVIPIKGNESLQTPVIKPIYSSKIIYNKNGFMMSY
jgi:hypothetical protein